MHEYEQIKMELVQVFDNFKLSMIEEEYAQEGTSWTDICPSIPESSTSNFWNALTIARIKLAEHIALTKLNA